MVHCRTFVQSHVAIQCEEIMMYRSIAILGLMLAAAGASLSAHHAASVAYHVDKEITVQGVVTEVKWENPHTWVYVEAKDANGKVVKWSFEGAVPNQLYRRGVTPAVLKPGVQVTIKAHPARNASVNAGEMTEVLGPDGKPIRAGLR
jgi:hypothetical protein